MNKDAGEKPDEDMIAVLREAGLLRTSGAQKGRGQNFLKDRDCAQRIVRCCETGGKGKLSSSLVVEIGAGAGALTRALLREGVRRIVAIESDARLAEFLRRWGKNLNETLEGGSELEVIEADARRVDYAELFEQRGCRAKGEGGDGVIVGNLPYSMGTVILRRLLEGEVRKRCRVMVLMFQREVAARLVAGVGDVAYGRLSILAGLRYRVERCFDVAPCCFVPAPRVVSCVVRFVPYEGGDVATVEEYGTVAEMTGLLFSHRRKKMSTVLRMAGREDWGRCGEAVEVDLSRRAGEVGREEWLRWAKAARQEQ